MQALSTEACKGLAVLLQHVPSGASAGGKDLPLLLVFLCLTLCMPREGNGRPGKQRQCVTVASSCGGFEGVLCPLAGLQGHIPA
jgi:hypothetical protein